MDEIKPKKSQERKSAKARAQSAKIKNSRNQAQKMPRAQGRNWGTAEAAVNVKASVTAEKILLYARKCATTEFLTETKWAEKIIYKSLEKTSDLWYNDIWISL